jgi:muramoyltetrapeptide carboxypeptidase
MNHSIKRIGIVAPGSPIAPEVAERVRALAAASFGGRVELHFHAQCFLSAGHFAGDDDMRANAFLEFANDPALDAVWFARGGYGAVRMLPFVIASLTGAEAEKAKTYLGYSDGGTLLAALYGHGFPRVAHGPMPSDIGRENGEAAVLRALRFLVEGARDALEPSIGMAPSAAFNIVILSHLIGTPWMPDLSGHVLMLEEVAEAMYRIDRDLAQITASPAIRQVGGIRLGRCSAIPPNDPEFGMAEEELAKHWCKHAGIAYLGRADIGHDAGNKVVPFGNFPAP